ncbi:MAG: hypothetical protein WCJ95_08235 [Mariniphaga sp.]
MKTTNFKTLILVASIVFSVISTDGQHLTGITKNVFNQIPANLKLPATPQRYLITTDYFNHTLQGAFIDKIRVSGTFTTNLPQNKEVWNKVSVAKSNQLNGSFDAGEPQNYMENFTYEPSEKILQPDFFKDFPFEAVQVKNLVWDMAGIEAFAWGHLDSLKLNKLYEVKKMNGTVPLAGLGTFTNNNIQLIWKGVSLLNNELCALIDFRAMDNPLECNIKMGEKDFSLKGTSHYWGTVYLSLSEKRFEYVELLENVMMEMKWSDQPTSQYVYTTRFMKVKKIE